MMQAAKLKVTATAIGGGATAAALVIVGILAAAVGLPLFRVERSVTTTGGSRCRRNLRSGGGAGRRCRQHDARHVADHHRGHAAVRRHLRQRHVRRAARRPAAPQRADSPWQSPDGRYVVEMPFRRPIVYMGGAADDVVHRVRDYRAPPRRGSTCRAASRWARWTRGCSSCR